nr:hypothetical protein Iba_chr10cCG12760 [Ipomoea batatas]
MDRSPSCSATASPPRPAVLPFRPAAAAAAGRENAGSLRCRGMRKDTLRRASLAESGARWCLSRLGDWRGEPPLRVGARVCSLNTPQRPVLPASWFFPRFRYCPYDIDFIVVLRVSEADKELRRWPSDSSVYSSVRATETPRSTFGSLLCQGLDWYIMN